MRTTPDFYRDFSGKIWAVWQDTKPPRDSVLIYGYDYYLQKWITTGKDLLDELIIKGKKPEIFKGEK